MNKEDKELLLKDLCARLPYGVICDIYNDTCTITEKLLIGGLSHFCDDTICVRPYLRSMSSMTDEEKKEFKKIVYDSMNIDDISASVYVADWLYSKHFDVHGLIPKGLAVEVTKKNNPYKD